MFPGLLVDEWSSSGALWGANDKIWWGMVSLCANSPLVHEYADWHGIELVWMWWCMHTDAFNTDLTLSNLWHPASAFCTTYNSQCRCNWTVYFWRLTPWSNNLFSCALFSRGTMIVHRVMAVPRLQVVKPTLEGLLSYLRATSSRLATPQCICPTHLFFTIINLRPTIIPPPSPAHHTPLRYGIF